MQSVTPSSRRATTVLALVIAVSMLLSAAAGAAAGGAVAYFVLRDRTPAEPIPAVTTASVNSESAGSPESAEGAAQAVAALAPSVVTVVNYLESNGGSAAPSDQGNRASGSGVIISDQGHVITNAHVVEGSRRLEVVLADGRSLPASLVGRDTFSDLAVIKIEPGAAPTAVFGDSDALLAGDTVIAIGSPLGDLTNTVTVGVVSARDRSIETSSGFQMEGLLQTDAAINSGNSGGPLVSLKGEVVGINTLVVRGSALSGASAEGLGFAIPSNTVKAIAAQLIATGQVTRPYLGIRWEWITPALAAANGLEVSFGAYVTDVTSGSPAAGAGLRMGDVVIGMDGTRFDGDSPFLNRLLTHAPGETVTLEVKRGAAELQLPVTLTERPSL
jgi:S1-C subfamily serine protease